MRDLAAQHHSQMEKAGNKLGVNFAAGGKLEYPDKNPWNQIEIDNNPNVFTHPTALILKLSLSNSKISTSCKAIKTILMNIL